MSWGVFGSKLTETGLYHPLFLISHSIGRYAVKKYINDFKIPDDERGIPFLAKINSTIFMSPSMYIGMCKWRTYICPYSTYVSRAGTYLICEVCRGYTAGLVNFLEKGYVERTKYVLAGDECCEYKLEIGKTQIPFECNITKNESYEQLMKVLASKDGTLNEYIEEVSHWLKTENSRMNHS